MPSAANDYHFVTRWTVPATTVAEVYATLADARALPRWWPAVYLAVTPVSPGRASDGLGAAFDLHTKGWLPYTLKWRLTVAELNPPYGSTINADGDFVGRGIWRFVQEGPDVAVTFDWKLTAEKPLLRWLSPVLKPLFGANHAWAMRQGEVSLRREIARRRSTPGKTVPAPPGPTTWQPWGALAGGVLAVLLVALGLSAVSRRGKDTGA
jgi:hypothetical protein